MFMECLSIWGRLELTRQKRPLIRWISALVMSWPDLFWPPTPPHFPPGQGFIVPEIDLQRNTWNSIWQIHLNSSQKCTFRIWETRINALVKNWSGRNHLQHLLDNINFHIHRSWIVMLLCNVIPQLVPWTSHISAYVIWQKSTVIPKTTASLGQNIFSHWSHLNYIFLYIMNHDSL